MVEQLEALVTVPRGQSRLTLVSYKPVAAIAGKATANYNALWPYEHVEHAHNTISILVSLLTYNSSLLPVQSLRFHFDLGSA